MKIATLKQIETAKKNISSKSTWNNQDDNFLLNQTEAIKERMTGLDKPKTTSFAAWQKYDAKLEALKEKLQAIGGDYK